MRKIILNGLISLVSIIVFFIILEIVIRIFIPQPVNIKGTRFSNTLRHENIPQATFTFKTSEFTTEIVYNNEGFRDNDFELKKKGFRVAILGDSYVDAQQVPFEHMFANQLEDLMNHDLRSIEVMNFGVSGYGTDQELIMLGNKVLKYKPDVVLLMYVHNDIQEIYTNNLIKYENGEFIYVIHNPNPLWKNFKAFIRNLHTYYYLKKKTLQIPFLLRTLDKIKIFAVKLLGEELVENHFPQIAKDVKHIIDRAGLSIELQAFLDPLSDEVKALWDFEFKLLKEIQNVLQQNNIKFGMVIITKSFQLDGSALDEYLSKYQIDKSQFVVNNPNKTLVEFAEKNNIPILDLYPLFKKYSDAGKMLHYRKDGHWNKLGNTLAAGEIYKFLIENELVAGTEQGIER